LRNESYIINVDKNIKEKIMDLAFGTKVYDTSKKQIGVLINTYNLGYIDAPDAMGAKVLSPNGKTYPQNLDYLRPVNEMDDKEIKEYNIPKCFLID
jgi:hypothetical protein